MARVTAWLVRAVLLAVIAWPAVACGLEEPSRANEIANQLARLPKPGKLNQGPALIKVVDDAGIARPAAATSRELTALVDGLRAVLATRPGAYALVTAAVLDNTTLANENPNPNYGQLLESWGRQTGYAAAFEQRGQGGQPGLMRASVILSRYGTPAGATSAYQYVVQQGSQAGRRLDLQSPPRDQAPWDEAVAFYNEDTTTNGQTIGSYRLIFRAGPLICFVSNWGQVGAVSARDTAELTQAIVERLASL